jgi:hypothetical protein
MTQRDKACERQIRVPARQAADCGSSTVSATPCSILVVVICGLRTSENCLLPATGLKKIRFFFHVFEERISHKGHSFKTFCFEVIKARLREGSQAPIWAHPCPWSQEM